MDSLGRETNPAPGSSARADGLDRKPPSTPEAVTTGIGELPRPVAFVLSGGSSLGALHVGMFRAVLESGIRPDLLVGSSVGAVNAAFLGRGFDRTGIEALAEIWRRLRTRDVFPGLGWRTLARLALGQQTLCSAARLGTLLDRHLPGSYEDLPVRTAVVASAVVSGEPVVFSTGDLRRHVLASTAIPAIFPPVEVDGRLLADGGIAAHVPLLPAARMGARTLVVFDSGYPCMLVAMPRGLLALTLHVATLMLRHQVLGALPLLKDDRIVVYLPAPCPLQVPAHDFSQGSLLIQAGYDAARSFLSGLRVERSGVYGHPHFHG